VSGLHCRIHEEGGRVFLTDRPRSPAARCSSWASNCSASSTSFSEGPCGPSPTAWGPLPLRSRCERCARGPSPACLASPRSASPHSRCERCARGPSPACLAPLAMRALRAGPQPRLPRPARPVPDRDASPQPRLPRPARSLLAMRALRAGPQPRLPRPACLAPLGRSPLGRVAAVCATPREGVLSSTSWA
jgi:hypothetical protein